MNALLQLLGGLGLFLLGMAVMTDGLRGLAGEYLNRVLARFTNGTLSGAVSGAVTTAVLQSSSATIVAAVGFVGAGLLTFPQALGVIFGANLGTTITGWMVALLGHKLQVGAISFPLVLVGALLYLLGHGRWRHVGFALAGFALLFQGIDALQNGMAEYGDWLTPESFPADTLGGRVQLLLIGAVITLVTQSSSAGVATALTAVYTGTMAFEQAAAMVIGMDVGTTAKAALATLGGSVDTRRTGYSHVVYNLLTAVGAFFLLDLYPALWDLVSPGALHAHAEVALVGFHTLFNLLGVIAVLPFAGSFAAMMCRLVPAPQDPVLDRLDRGLLQNPDVALDSVAQILAVTTREVFGFVASLLHGARPDTGTLQRSAAHLAALQGFVDQLHLQPEQQRNWQRLNAAIHMLDHLQRLHERCAEDAHRALNLARAPALATAATQFCGVLDDTMAGLAAGEQSAAIAATRAAAEHMAEHAGGLRAAIMAEVAGGQIDVPAGTRRLESVRWLRRVSYHVWRVCEHSAVLMATPADSHTRGTASTAGDD